MPFPAKQQKTLNEAHEERLRAELRAEALKNNILRLQAQEAQLDAALSTVHHAAPTALHADQQPLPTLCKTMPVCSFSSPTACKHVAGKEQRTPGRLQQPNSIQSVLLNVKVMKTGKTCIATRHVSKMARSSSSIKAACPAHSTAIRFTPSCRDAESSHPTVRSSQLPSHKVPIQPAMQSRATPAQGKTATATSSSKGSRKLGTTSDGPDHGVADAMSELSGSVASRQQGANCVPTVTQVGSHSFRSEILRPSSSLLNSTDDCQGSYCTDDQAAQQSLQQPAETYKLVQAKQASAMSCRALATAQQDLTGRNDTAHALQEQQGHVPQLQQQQLLNHVDGPQSSEGLAQQPKVSPSGQVGLRRLSGQCSHSAGVNRGSSSYIGREVVRTLSQPGSAAHMMQRLN